MADLLRLLISELKHRAVDVVELRSGSISLVLLSSSGTRADVQGLITRLLGGGGLHLRLELCPFLGNPALTRSIAAADGHAWRVAACGGTDIEVFLSAPTPPPPPPPPPPPLPPAPRAAATAGPTRAELTLPVRCVGAAATAAVRAVLASLGAPPVSSNLSALSCRLADAVAPTGELEGNCAYSALLRSSGAVFGSRRGEEREADACALLRRAVVAHLATRLVREGEAMAELINAVNVAADGGGGGGGSSKMSAAFLYLSRHLASGRVTDSTRYAGPLELAALAALARRDVVIFAEAGSADDGAVFRGAAACEEAGSGPPALPPPPLPPLVAINTRRRHMRPIAVSFGAGGDAVPVRAADLAAAAIAELGAAIDAAGGGAVGLEIELARGLLARLS